jgi:hypothetical protein
MRGESEPAGDGRVVDPGGVQTVAELKMALNKLRGIRSYAALIRETSGALSKSTISDLLKRPTTVPTQHTMIAFLTACGLDGDTQMPWLEAWERAATAHLRRPEGAVRVSEARPRLLGVHASIQVDSYATDLPVYVPRDLDSDLRTAVTVAADDLPPYVARDLDAYLRAAVNAAAEQGGVVLVVGGSSVGKTRALFEAVRSVVPEWWLLHPADPDSLRAFAEEPADRTVVWLDEMQRYLDHAGGLSASVARRLVIAGVVIVATLWPGEYRTRTAPRSYGESDTYANDRELLRMAKVVRVPETLSRDERRRAEELAADPRIRIALNTIDAGFTQVVAAGPALVSWWEDAADDQCYGKAVITSALDARLVGAQAPLTREFLEAAAPGYLTPAQQATAPADWLNQALRYATKRLHGAASTIAPVPAGMGQIAGYTVADYLHQHVLRTRRADSLPDTTWHALGKHHRPDGPGEADRLAERLEEYGHIDEAIAILANREESDGGFSTDRYAMLLAERGSLEEAVATLRRRADAGDEYLASVLADLLAEHGRIDELRARASSGDDAAVRRMINLLAEMDHPEDLRKFCEEIFRHHSNRLT